MCSRPSCCRHWNRREERGQIWSYHSIQKWWCCKFHPQTEAVWEDEADPKSHSRWYPGTKNKTLHCSCLFRTVASFWLTCSRPAVLYVAWPFSINCMLYVPGHEQIIQPSALQATHSKALSQLTFMMKRTGTAAKRLSYRTLRVSFKHFATDRALKSNEAEHKANTRTLQVHVQNGAHKWQADTQETGTILSSAYW